MKTRARKLFAVIQIILQLLPPSSLIYLSPTFNATAKEIKSSSEKQSTNNAGQSDNSIAQGAVQAGSLLSSDNASDALGSAVVSAAAGKAASSAQQWLSQFGTARVNISTDEHFTLNDSDLDLLVPLYNGKENMFFTQLGGRRHDERNIVNGGFGYRHFNQNWMWGTNVFYDRQVSGNQHQRLGFGSEMGWDYLKISANGYLRLSDWMSSSAYEDYDERVANGFDLRATGYLPAHPQLGANIIYEQYYGDSVGLFGDDDDDRQKDPYAVTLGVNYTPVPLVTMGLNQKMGKSGENDTQVNLALTWTPGVPLSAQLDPSQVALRRTLQGGRMDLVDRNNNIVLEYRKQEVISLSLPPELEGAEQSKQAVTARVKAKHGLDRIEWQGDSFFSHGGKITAGGSPEQFVMTLPVWQGSSSNSYALNATAWDKSGNASKPAQMTVTVNGIDVSTLQSTTVVSPAKIPADGKTPATVSVTLKTATGEAATGLAPRLTATLTSSATGGVKMAGLEPEKAPTIAAFTESGNGAYTATLTSGTTPDTLTIQPLVDGTTKLATAKLIEEATVLIPQITALDSSATSALADGSASITLTAHVTDQYGKVLPGVTLDWSADSAQAVLSVAQSSTDENGSAQIQVSSKDVIATVVTAKLPDGNTMATPSLTFTADISTAKVATIDSEKQQVVANNNDTDKITAQVTDNFSHPLSGVTVIWTVEKTDNTPVITKTSTTDISGNAVLTLKSPKTGSVTVSAEVKGTPAQETDPIIFVADTSSQRVNTIMLSKEQALANGTDSITYTATVTDAQGNVIDGAVVNWLADSSDAKLSTSQTTSASDGTSQITVTSMKAGDVVVTAQTRESVARQADKVTFIADASTAQVQSIISDKTTALATGSDAIMVSATVTDANGNVLSGSDVSWSAKAQDASSATGKLSAGSSKTNASGVAQVQLTATDAAKFTVTASDNGSTKSLQDLSFTADSSTAQVSSLTADKTTDIVAEKDTVTLTAVVVDAKNNPVPGATLNWSSSEPDSNFSANTSVTDEQGTAMVTFTSLKAGNIDVTATTGSSSKVQPLQVIGNQATAKVTGIVADKSQAVADGKETITWTATVTDANGNVLTDSELNWGTNLEEVTLTPASSDTDVKGKATTTGTSLKAGTVKVTATPVTNPQGAATASNVSFIGDITTAKISKLSANTSSVHVGSESATYTAQVTDANDNIVSAATVSWSTTLNTLSATESQTNSSGNATVKLSGLTVGQARVTATLNESSMTDSSVAFINDYSGEWNIVSSGDTATGTNWDTQHISGLPHLGFITTGDTQGPTELINSSPTASTLIVPMTDDNGNKINVTLSGVRANNCGAYSLNSAGPSCYGDDSPTWANLQFHVSSNNDLPAGVYHGTVHLQGTDRDSSWTFNYEVITTLTVN